MLFFTAPDEPGDYEFRLFESFELPDIARSNIVTVQEGTLPTSEEVTILFEANFDDGYAPGFGNEVGNWEVHLFTGKYTATTDTYRFSMAGDTNWQDYVIDADFFNAQDGGLLVRAQDQDNCIALIVRPSYNDIYWYVRKGGMWADYKGQVTLGHEPGEELQVKVEVVGSEFKAYVNDVLKTTLENTEFPKGKIGLYLYYQPDQYWDNVVVYSSGATGPAPTPTTQEPSVDELPEFLFGNIETFDFDNDGSEDKYVYSFDREEVAEDLFLDKSMELDKTDSGFSGKIILRFENTGDKAIEYSHIEVIPKSFAESVDELEFSRPPDEIIEADPVLKYDIKTRKNKEEVIEVASKRASVVAWERMNAGTLQKMTEEETLKWIHKQIDPYEENIRVAAKKHNIPPRLLATVILNELGDYGLEDQLQEVAYIKGSVGMAQITINTAKKHGLVDVTEDNIKKFLETSRRYRTIEEGGIEIPYPREYAIDYITWERLNQPEYAIEGAAREINWILDNVNKNLDKTWAKSLLKGPIDRSDPYKNLKLELESPDPMQRRINRESGLAVLVVGPYNSDSILIADFDLKSAYQYPSDEKEPYYSARTHAVNAKDFFVELLIKYGFFEENEEAGEEKEDKREEEKEKDLLDCPPCVECGSGLKLDAECSSEIDDANFSVRCTYLGSSHDLLQDEPFEDDVSSSPIESELIPDLSSAQDSLANEFVDMGWIYITYITKKLDAEKSFSENYSRLARSCWVDKKTYRKGPKKDDELSVVHELEMLYYKEDQKNLDSLPSVPHVIVDGVFLYRERYYIEVNVEVFDRPKDAVINTFDELVNCAKAVVDEMEGVD